MVFGNFDPSAHSLRDYLGNMAWYLDTLIDRREGGVEFIEDHIVETLRRRRGTRQYIFATRNANVLVSGDAEQVLSLESDAHHGRIERSGSIDRLSTRDLILMNLEGGAEAFARRSLKYGIQAS